MYTVQTSGFEAGSRREAIPGTRFTRPEPPAAAPFIRLCPLTAGLRRPLARAALEDNHRVIAPTHVVVRSTPQPAPLEGVADEVVGYASLGAQALFFAWLHTRRLNKYESFRAWRLAEALAAGQGLCLAVSPDSPLLPYVERMGYERLGEAILFLKRPLNER